MVPIGYRLNTLGSESRATLGTMKRCQKRMALPFVLDTFNCLNPPLQIAVFGNVHFEFPTGKVLFASKN